MQDNKWLKLRFGKWCRTRHKLRSRLERLNVTNILQLIAISGSRSVQRSLGKVIFFVLIVFVGSEAVAPSAGGAGEEFEKKGLLVKAI